MLTKPVNSGRKGYSSIRQGYRASQIEPAIKTTLLTGDFSESQRKLKKSLSERVFWVTGFMRDCLYTATKSTPPGSNDKIYGFLAFSNYYEYPGLFSKQVLKNEFFF
jgi:hypothetical protein